MSLLAKVPLGGRQGFFPGEKTHDTGFPEEKKTCGELAVGCAADPSNRIEGALVIRSKRLRVR